MSQWTDESHKIALETIELMERTAHAVLYKLGSQYDETVDVLNQLERVPYSDIVSRVRTLRAKIKP